MKKEKSTRRKEQGEATKKKIFDTAQRLFIENGIDQISVEDIVATVGVARGTFYVHFESKDALISSMIYSYVDKVDIDYEAFMRTVLPEATSCDVLLALAEKICDIIENSVGYDSLKILYKVQLNVTQQMQAALNYNRALYKIFTDVLEKGAAKGDFNLILPVEELARHLVLAIRGITYEWCIRYPELNIKEHVRKHFQILLNGIKA